MTRRDEVVALLRRRIVAGLHAGGLGGGDRLPSTRQMATRLGVDPRLVLAAYGELAEEGLVELRPRSGIYVAARAASGMVNPPAASWLVDLLDEGIGREIAAPDLGEWLRRAVETLRLRAAVVAATADQLEGIAAELRTYYGLDADCVSVERLDDDSRPPAELRRADVVVTTEGLEARLRPVTEALGRPMVLASVRPDLVGDEWRRLLAGPIAVVVADARFATLVRGYLARWAAAEHVQTLVVGEDDVATIPPDRPVYVTRSARERLAGRPVPGVLLPPARIFSPESSRALLSLIVNANLRAVAARTAAP